MTPHFIGLVPRASGRTAAALLAAALLAGAAPARAAEVRLAGDALTVDGAPFQVRGSSALSRFAELKAAGATTVRTYGDDPGPILDAAGKAGLKVIAGFWMAHPRKGFDYGNRAAVEAQLAALKAMVERYRAHPALLMWGVGNEVEVELPAHVSEPTIWAAVDEAGRLVKALDPAHPVMLAVAEVGGNKAAEIRAHAPSIDVLGINGYGDGLPSAAARARAQGWSGPIILTEMGAQGHWDAPATPWGAPRELTSTDKAERMRRYLVAARDANVGVLPFLWGQKQEVTPTYYSLFLPTGEWTETVEAIAETWGGTVPGGPNHAPRIATLAFAAGETMPAGGRLLAQAAVSDPDGDPLALEWNVMAEKTGRSVGGDPEEVPASFPQAVHPMPPAGEAGAVEVRGLPAGRYRLFLTVRDGRGAAATGNLPFLVE